MRYKGNRFTERFDANTYLYVTKPWTTSIWQRHGSLAAAFANSAHVMYLVVSFTSDWLYPTYHSKEIVSALTCRRRGRDLLQHPVDLGARCVLAEVETMTALIGDFLDRVVEHHGINLRPSSWLCHCRIRRGRNWG